MSLQSPKLIPRVHLSPKLKSLPIKKVTHVSPSRHHYKNNPFLIKKEQFRQNPDINPISGRSIKKGSKTYLKLVHLYGEPY
ncbi:MAG TPA: hypothetical protein VLG50_07530 [Candidatus Saccharimonadales bacterium]|nr:hypothetical protein [Candidatus Saccharimonadales bacterium]